MDLAPIILFVYNRPESTQLVLDALSMNPESKDSLLYIYCDGAKVGTDDIAQKKINHTREIVRNEKRFKNVFVIENKENKGLSISIIDGVTEICKQFGFAIVLEDDILVSRYFLNYMNQSLNLYKNVNEVGSINGYWYPIDEKFNETFFLRNQSCWGWATWERAWNLFQSNGSKLLKELESKKLVKEFDLDGAYEYTKMLSDQISGKNDSWAIRWDASMFLENKLSLYPSISLVKNIGFDGEGSHCEISNDYNTIISEKKIEVFSVPLNEDKKARKLLSKFYHKIRFKNRVDRLKSIFRF